MTPSDGENESAVLIYERFKYLYPFCTYFCCHDYLLFWYFFLSLPPLYPRYPLTLWIIIFFNQCHSLWQTPDYTIIATSISTFEYHPWSYQPCLLFIKCYSKSVDSHNIYVLHIQCCWSRFSYKPNYIVQWVIRSFYPIWFRCPTDSFWWSTSVRWHILCVLPNGYGLNFFVLSIQYAPNAIYCMYLKLL